MVQSVRCLCQESHCCLFAPLAGTFTDPSSSPRTNYLKATTHTLKNVFVCFQVKHLGDLQHLSGCLSSCFTGSTWALWFNSVCAASVIQIFFALSHVHTRFSCKQFLREILHNKTWFLLVRGVSLSLVWSASTYSRNSFSAVIRAEQKPCISIACDLTAHRMWIWVLWLGPHRDEIMFIS